MMGEFSSTDLYCLAVPGFTSDDNKKVWNASIFCWRGHTSLHSLSL